MKIGKFRVGPTTIVGKCQARMLTMTVLVSDRSWGLVCFFLIWSGLCFDCFLTFFAFA